MTGIHLGLISFHETKSNGKTKSIKVVLTMREQKIIILNFTQQLMMFLK